MTQIVAVNAQSELSAAAHSLRAGHLVAFPTETVYGLGADARSHSAVSRVFEVKNRPSTDPLIVHCYSYEQSVSFVDARATPWQRRVHACLARCFWPGALTLILPANTETISKCVTGGSGWVGLRCPDHPVALAFLESCGVPVAAPSANLFGHVSPTCAVHVQSDFPDVDNLWILDGGSCGLGIESTVVRINDDESIDILRRGGIGQSRLMEVLLADGLFESRQNANQRVRLIEKHVTKSNSSQDINSPGQRLVHYAPRLPAFMLDCVDSAGAGDGFPLGKSALERTVVIDFGARLSLLETVCGKYRDLSKSSLVEEAAQQLFTTLRWAEDQAPSTEDNWQIWIVNPLTHGLIEDNEFFAALADRIFRAASGRTASVFVKPNSDQVFFSVR